MNLLAFTAVPVWRRLFGEYHLIADVLSLAGKLVEEELVRVSEEEFSPPTAPSVTGDKRPYQTPALDVYRDIGHLVALDPPMPGLKDLPWKGPTDR